MSYVESGRLPSPSRNVRSQCPDCPGNLAVMRVMGGRTGSEYWTLRCVRCGGIQLDVVHPHAQGDAPAA
jgi:uncharacterized Zn finger protein